MCGAAGVSLGKLSARRARPSLHSPVHEHSERGHGVAEVCARVFRVLFHPASGGCRPAHGGGSAAHSHRCHSRSHVVCIRRRLPRGGAFPGPRPGKTDRQHQLARSPAKRNGAVPAGGRVNRPAARAGTFVCRRRLWSAERGIWLPPLERAGDHAEGRLCAHTAPPAGPRETHHLLGRVRARCRRERRQSGGG